MPVSVIVRAAPEPKAPELRCLHVLHAVLPGQPLMPAQSVSDVQGTAGFLKSGVVRAPQNPQKTKSWCGRSVEVLLAEPVVRANGIASVASEVADGGSQSWLVGKASPVVRSSAGVQGWPSCGPPLQRSVVALQIGHGWVVALSSAQVPPGQSPSLVQARPTSLGSVVPAQRFGRMSPIRYTVELSRKSMLPVPVSQRAAPLAGLPKVLMAQVLRAGLDAIGMGSGAPKKHPTSVQSRVPLVSPAVALPSVKAFPVHPVTFRSERPLSGVWLGTSEL